MSSHEGHTSDAIATLTGLIYLYIAEMPVSEERQDQIARNVGDAVLWALQKKRKETNSAR